MRASPTLGFLAVFGWLVAASVAEAQSSFSRSSGSSLNRSSSSRQTSSGRPTTGLSGTGNASASFAAPTIDQMLQEGAGDQFLRSNRGSSSFVGADDSTTGGSNAGRSNRRLSATNARGFGGQSPNANANRGGMMPGGRSPYGQAAAEVQPVLTLGFDYAPPAIPNLGGQVTARLERTGAIKLAAPLDVQLADGVAVVRGTVASEHDRLLLAQLLALEPGVRRVDNQLEVKK